MRSKKSAKRPEAPGIPASIVAVPGKPTTQNELTVMPKLEQAAENPERLPALLQLVAIAIITFAAALLSAIPPTQPTRSEKKNAKKAKKGTSASTNRRNDNPVQAKKTKVRGM